MVGLSGTGILILDWALFGLSTFFVFFRLWIRVRKLWRLGLSDYFILSSWLAVGMVCAFNTILYVLQLNYSEPGLSRTMAMLMMPYKQVIISAKIVFAMNITYVFLMWLVKASFLSLLAPPFLHLPLKYRLLFWSVALYNFLTFLVVLALNIFWCFPVSRNWTVFPINEYCTPALSSVVFIITFVVHITTDLTVLILPLFIISSLGMQSRREHAGIAFVFIIGGISIAASVARCAIAFSSGTFDMMSAMKTAQLEVWTPVEQNTAIIAACLPSMRVLIRRAAQSVRAQSGKQASAGTSSGLGAARGPMGRKEMVEKEQGLWSRSDVDAGESVCERGYAGSGSEVELNDREWRRSAISTDYANSSQGGYGDLDLDPRYIAIAR